MAALYQRSTKGQLESADGHQRRVWNPHQTWNSKKKKWNRHLSTAQQPKKESKKGK